MQLFFLSRFQVLGDEVAKILLDEKSLMTPEDMLDFANAERCFICNKSFPTDYSNKVLDQYHQRADVVVPHITLAI